MVRGWGQDKWFHPASPTMSGPQAPGLPKKAYPGPPETPPLPPPQLPSPQPPRAWWQDPHPDPALGSSIRMRGTLGACGLTSIKSSGWHWALPDGAPRMTGDKALVPTEQGGPATGHTHGRLQVSFLGLLAWACRRLCQPPTRAPHPSLCQAQYPHPPTHPPAHLPAHSPRHIRPHTLTGRLSGSWRPQGAVRGAAPAAGQLQKVPSETSAC